MHDAQLRVHTQLGSCACVDVLDLEVLLSSVADLFEERQEVAKDVERRPTAIYL